jgi:hypothetical protein
MSHKIKALGLALAAVFAMSAVAAQAASAHTFVTDSGNPAYLTGTQEPPVAANTLLLTGSGEEVHCEAAHYESTGTVASGEEEVTVHPVYEECYSGLAPNPGEVEVRTNECHFTLTGTTDGNGHAEAHVNCGASPIELEIPGACTFTIGTQTPTGGGVHYTNHTTATPMDFTVQATVTGIHYHAHGPLCFLVAEGEISSETFTADDADFTSSITVKCYKNAAHTEQVGCTINGATNEA